MSDVTTISASTTPVTLAAMKTHLNVSSTLDDAYIITLLTAATEMLERRCNRCFMTQTRTLKMQTFYDGRYVRDGYQGKEVYLPRGPLGPSVNITYVDSQGTTTTMPSSDYIATADGPPRITQAYNATWPATRNHADDIAITYDAGYGVDQDDMPANVVHAIKLTAGHWYRNREAVATGTISKEIELGVDALLADEVYPQYG